MKRAKIALTAVGVLAIVGGALAFKARQLNTFYKAAPGASVCSVMTQLTLTKTIQGGAISANLTDVFNAPTPCSIRVTTAP